MNSVKIACLGDVMCGESFYCMGDGVGTSLARYGRDFLDSEVADYVRSHDVAMCNVECVISDVGKSELSLRRSQMRARPEAAEHLAGWGINIANVANNHILEHGQAAAVDTVENLERAGIKTVGAGAGGAFEGGMQVVELEFGGRVIAFIGACFCSEKYAYSGGAQFYEILDTVRDLREQGKAAVVSVHWGDELMDRPSIRQRRKAAVVVGSGASLIVGHHPHVLQGIEKMEGALVAYSLGNFIFSGMHPQTHWSIILSVTLSDEGGTEYDYRLIEKDGEHRPRFVTGERKPQLLAEVERRCALLASEVNEYEYDQAYAAEGKALKAEAKHDFRLKVIKRMHRMRPVYVPQVLLRPVQRRLGMW
jgi:hypothetical protein